VTVNDTEAQSWDGFGGAFNELGWSYLTTQEMQDKAIQMLFGDDGCRFGWGRIPIGASDYGVSRYTDDEVTSGSDTSMSSFSIDRDKEKLIPYIKAAQAVKADIKFWGSPWTPPTWMKATPYLSPGNPVNAFDGGTMKSDDATMAAYAQYLIKFVNAYGEQGIAIEAISPQNEPGYTGNYPTCGWSQSTYTKFIGQFLGPAVASAGMTTKIMLGSFNGGGSDPGIVASVMADSAARGYVDVLGFQWGMQSMVASAKSYHLPIWQTEHRCGNYPWEKPFNATMAPNDQAYAVESWGLIRDWIRAGATAYSAWNMVLDKMEELVKGEVKRTFNPEFLNRLDEVILFQSLSDADLIQIVELLVQQLNANLAQKSITISVTEDAKKWILDKTLGDRSYGARPLRRALQRYVEDPLSEALIAGKISERPAFLEVYLEIDQLYYRPITADETISEDKPAGMLLFSN